jgi:hypothetical protein
MWSMRVDREPNSLYAGYTEDRTDVTEWDPRMRIEATDGGLDRVPDGHAAL